MIPIEREFIRRRAWTSAIGKALAFLLCGSSANATYVAAIFNDDAIVIGADSRATDFNEVPISDSFCKIVVVNDKIAFAGLNAATYSLPTGETVNILDLASKSAASTIPESATKFAEMVVSKMNSTPPGRKPPPQLNPLSVGIFGGFDEHEIPSVANVTIFYSDVLDAFQFEPAQRHINAEKIVAINYLDATREIVASAEFKAVRENRNGPNSERLAKTLESLINEMIRRKVSIEVGGTPTVLIIEKGRRPRWYSKAKDCPDLQQSNQ